jgi:O-methyltransferase involved in polyketide biosynthesis/acyl-coenzyme A thioesterase PaaI-like protein
MILNASADQFDIHQATPATADLSMSRFEKAEAQRSSTSTIFPPETWKADRRVRYEIGPVTASFHRSVPSLRYLNWTIEEIARGYAVTRLPLNVESSNQYVTQQAALMLLAADYTGGIALSTLFEETPIIGFHPQLTDFGAYLWGAAATIKWLRPSTDDLILKSTIPERDWDGIATAFARGEEINYKARVKMYSDGGRIAAVCDFQYWARSSHSLRATGANLNTTHHMLTHKLRTSARLIAGLRSEIKLEEASRNTPVDLYAARAAGPQGIAMARKFSLDTPQLADLVRSRTESCDEALRSYSQRHSRFLVVNIGCGYDSRPWRMRDLGGATFAVLDLPVMIKDRGNVLPPANESPYQILTLNYDILVDELADTLRRSAAPTDVPIFFIWEGCSMYFSRTESDAFLRQIKNLMSPACRLWFDFASSDAVGDLTEQYEVKAFMDSMRMIGEPFMRGFSDVKVELAGVGLHVKECKSAAQLLGGTDPVLDHYSFALCGSMGD